MTIRNLYKELHHSSDMDMQTGETAHNID